MRQNIKLAVDKATITDMGIKVSGWKFTAEAFKEKLSATKEEISRLTESFEELSALARAVMLR